MLGVSDINIATLNEDRTPLTNTTVVALYPTNSVKFYVTNVQGNFVTIPYNPSKGVMKLIVGKYGYVPQTLFITNDTSITQVIKNVNSSNRLEINFGHVISFNNEYGISLQSSTNGMSWNTITNFEYSGVNVYKFQPTNKHELFRIIK